MTDAIGHPPALTPYLCVADARAAMAWYADVLGARVTYDPIVMDDGRVGHVELGLGPGSGARLMMAEEFPEVGVAPPDPERGAAVSLHLTVPDVDAVVEKAVARDARLDRAPADPDSPDRGRSAVLRDPFGHRWLLTEPAKRE